MRHSFAATNPCHVYDMAVALHEMGGLDCYYSGYPEWRLHPPRGFPIRSRSWRTLVTYAMQRLPESMRIDDARMFRWQDRGFDAAVAGILKGEGYIHGLPGQCLEVFTAGKRLGLTTVLNHASGPIKQWRALVAPEYERMGRSLEDAMPLPKAYEERLAGEWGLADFHCVASSVVRDQLMMESVPADKIWVVPYGANETLFRKRGSPPSGKYKICFAGRQSLRKGIHYLLKALEISGSHDWELHCFGMQFEETANDFAAYAGGARIFQRGSLSQRDFADALRDMDVLVLPSAEEAFGLVVVQALQAGVPCIVSDRVGAKDLIRPGQTGSIVPFGDAAALSGSLHEWAGRRMVVGEEFPWSDCAKELVRCGNLIKID